MRPPLIRVFHCPKCNRVIRTTVDRCKYCSAPIDRRAAEAAAHREDRIYEAGLDAERTEGLLTEQQSYWILRVVFILAAPFFFARWWFLYRDLPSDDPDIAAAKRKIRGALAIWVPLMIALGLLIAQLSGC